MFDIDRFVADCVAADAESQPALAVKELLQAAVADPSAVDAALGPPAVGGIRNLYSSTELTVLQIVWPPHVQLFPHDHRMWAAIGIYGGVETNAFFRRRPDGRGLEDAGGVALNQGDVRLLGPDVIHAVANPERTYTAAIHVYGGDFFATPRSQWPSADDPEQAFDVSNVDRVLAEADARARASSR